MKKTSIVLLIIIIIIIGGVWYALNQKNQPQNLNNQQSQTQTEELSEQAVKPDVLNTDQEAESKLVGQAAYQCDDGKTITADFYTGENTVVEPGQAPVPTGKVRLFLDNGEDFELLQTISADGARYANSDESFVFWDKGDKALVLENGVEVNYKNCVASHPASTDN